MDSRSAVAKQLVALTGGVFDAEIRDRGVVVTQLVQFGGERRGNASAAEGCKPFDLRRALNRDDAWNKGDFDAMAADHVLAEGKKVGVIEEQLRNDEIGSG